MIVVWGYPTSKSAFQEKPRTTSERCGETIPSDVLLSLLIEHVAMHPFHYLLDAKECEVVILGNVVALPSALKPACESGAEGAAYKTASQATRHKPRLNCHQLMLMGVCVAVRRKLKALEEESESEKLTACGSVASVSLFPRSVAMETFASLQERVRSCAITIRAWTVSTIDCPRNRDVELEKVALPLETAESAESKPARVEGEQYISPTFSLHLSDQVIRPFDHVPLGHVAFWDERLVKPKGDDWNFASSEAD